MSTLMLLAVSMPYGEVLCNLECENHGTYTGRSMTRSATWYKHRRSREVLEKEVKNLYMRPPKFQF
jgi:hypothetical protein